MAYPVSTGGSDQWQTSDGNKHDSMGAAQIAQDNIDSGKNMSFTNAQTSTQYRTPDGQTFNNEADAQKHIRDKEEMWRGIEAWVAEQAKIVGAELNELFKPARTLGQLTADGNACYDRGDWDGAISSFTKAVGMFNDQKLRDYEKQFRNFLDSTQIGDIDTKTVEFFRRCKSYINTSYKGLSAAYSKRAKKRETQKILMVQSTIKKWQLPITRSMTISVMF